MPETIASATVAILHAENKRPWGTGFVIGKTCGNQQDKTYVLTCAHVIADCLDRPALKYEVNPPDDPVFVGFRVQETPVTLKGHVCRWGRYIDHKDIDNSELAGQYATRDLALIELDSPAPETARPVRLWMPGDVGRWGQMLRNKTLIAEGYPRWGADDFSHHDFEYLSAADGLELKLGQVKNIFNYDDLKGLSGAGLVIAEYGLVIGMVTQVGTDKDLIIVKPANQLHQFWGKSRLVFHGSTLKQNQRIPDLKFLDINRKKKHKIPIRKAVKAAARKEAGIKVIMPVLMGESDNRLSEWIHFIYSSFVKSPLYGFKVSTAPVDPIDIENPDRDLDGEELWDETIGGICRILGIESVDPHGFHTQVRHILNGKSLPDQGPVDAPPYLVFRFSAVQFDGAEQEVFERLVKFFGQMTAQNLKHPLLVFIVFIDSTGTDSGDTDHLKFQGIHQKLVTGKYPRHEHLLFLPPVPGATRDDSLEWIEKYEIHGDKRWKMTPATAGQFRSVISDIFEYEAPAGDITLTYFQKQMERLHLSLLTT